MQIQDGQPVFLALVVRDLDRSIAFYRDVLGMKEVKQVHVDDDKAVIGGFSRKGFDFRAFRMGPVVIKLVTVQGEPPSTTGGVDLFTGVRYIAFTVDDLDGVRAELEAAGVEFESKTLPPEPDQQIGRLVFFRDPDGNLLELYGD